MSVRVIMRSQSAFSYQPVEIRPRAGIVYHCRITVVFFHHQHDMVTARRHRRPTLRFGRCKRRLAGTTAAARCEGKQKQKAHGHIQRSNSKTDFRRIVLQSAHFTFLIPGLDLFFCPQGIARHCKMGDENSSRKKSVRSGIVQSSNRARFSFTRREIAETGRTETREHLHSIEYDQRPQIANSALSLGRRGRCV